MAAELLVASIRLVDHIKVYQVQCKDVLEFAMKAGGDLSDERDWILLLQQIHQSFTAWARLDILNSLRQSEQIREQILNFRDSIARECCLVPYQVPQFFKALDPSSLLPTLDVVLRSDEALAKLYSVGESERIQLITLLIGCRDALPAKASQRNELDGVLRRLQMGDYSDAESDSLPVYAPTESDGPSRMSQQLEPGLRGDPNTSPTPSSLLLTESPIETGTSGLPAFPFEGSKRSTIDGCRCMTSQGRSHAGWCPLYANTLPPESNRNTMFDYEVEPPPPTAPPRFNMPDIGPSSPVSSRRNHPKVSLPLSVSSEISPNASNAPRQLPRLPTQSSHPLVDVPEVIIASPSVSRTSVATEIFLGRASNTATPTSFGGSTMRPELPRFIDSTEVKANNEAPSLSSFDQDVELPRTIPSTPQVDYDTCNVRLALFVHSEQDFVSSTTETEFIHQIRNGRSPLIPASRVDDFTTRVFGLFLQVKSAHRDVVQSLLPLTSSLIDLDRVLGLFLLSQDGVAVFSAVLPEYAKSLRSTMEAVYKEADQNSAFREWLKNGQGDRLFAYLHEPFERIEAYYETLRDILGIVQQEIPSTAYPELHQTLEHWERLVYSTRLCGWQGSLGCDPIFGQDFEGLTMNNVERYSVDYRRQLAQFKIVQLQTWFVDKLSGFIEAFKHWLETSAVDQPPEIRTLTSLLSLLLKYHNNLLDSLHSQQRHTHPELDKLIATLDNEIPKWESAYDGYAEGLHRAMGTIISSQLHMHDFLPESRNPLLLGQSLLELLQSPLLHINNLNQAARAYLCVLPDAHRECGPLTGVITKILRIWGLVKQFECWNGINLEMAELRLSLVWPQGDEEARELGIGDKWRKAIYRGWVLMPASPLGIESQKTSMGSSLGMVAPDGAASDYRRVFVILLDNCVLFTVLEDRWSLANLTVFRSIDYTKLQIESPEITAVATRGLYLIASSTEKRVASALLLRDTIRKDTLTILTRTAEECEQWREWFERAKAGRTEARKPTSLFTLPAIATLPTRPESLVTFSNAGGEQCFLYSGAWGTRSGLWLKIGEGHPTLLQGDAVVKRCVFVEDLRIIILSFDRERRLSIYKADEIILRPNNLDSSRIYTKTGIQFFKVGYLRNRLLLVLAMDNLPLTQIRWYDLNQLSLARGGALRFWADKLKHVGMLTTGSIIYDLDILPNDGLAFFGDHGFQLANIDSEEPNIRNLPATGSLGLSEDARRCKEARPLGIYRTQDKFLLCYTDFGIFVNQAGVFSGRAISWKTSQRMQHVSFIQQYVVLVSSSALEIRLLSDGHLVDQLPGENIQVLRGADPVRGESLGAIINRNRAISPGSVADRGKRRAPVRAHDRRPSETGTIRFAENQVNEPVEMLLVMQDSSREGSDVELLELRVGTLELT